MAMLIERLVEEILLQESEFPELVRNVLPDVGYGSVGANDDLRVFVGTVSLLGFGARSTHDPAAFVLAFGLFVENAAVERFINVR